MNRQLRLSRPRVRVAVVLAACAASCGVADAHPHVWVEAKTQVLFGKDGKVTGVHNDWVFDEMYSAFAVEGLETGGKLATSQELTSRAKENIDGLKDYGYFTFAKTSGHPIAFAPPIDYTLEERPDKRVVLHFTLPLAKPTTTGRAFSLQIYDPTYYVDFEFAAKDPVALEGAPPGCSDSVLGANPLVVADGQKLAKSFDTGLAPSDNFALTMASRVIVACP